MIFVRKRRLNRWRAGWFLGSQCVVVVVGTNKFSAGFTRLAETSACPRVRPIHVESRAPPWVTAFKTSIIPKGSTNSCCSGGLACALCYRSGQARIGRRSELQFAAWLVSYRLFVCAAKRCLAGRRPNSVANSLLQVWVLTICFN